MTDQLTKRYNPNDVMYYIVRLQGLSTDRLDTQPRSTTEVRVAKRAWSERDVPQGLVPKGTADPRTLKSLNSPSR